MRTLALDMGDVWVGTAISDELGITCRPLKTVKRPELISFLQETITQFAVGTVVVGLPTSLSGGDTEQTRKTRKIMDELRAQFSKVAWEFLDERLTSYQAVAHQRDVKKQRLSAQSKEESHSLAAAFLLRDYLG